jgi:site-specific recombinase XerD
MPSVRPLIVGFAIVAVCWMGSRPDDAMNESFVHPDELAGALAFPTLWKRYRRHLLIERRAAANTVVTYRKALYGFHGFLGAKAWQRATVRDLERFLSRPANSTTGHLAANSQRLEAVAVCGLYRWAWRQRYVATDRMGAFTPPKGGQPQPRGFDEGQLRQILLAADHDDRLYVMVSLAYFAGLRCAEIAQLRIEDVDLRRGLLIASGKGGRRRPVPIYPELAAALRRYLAGRAAAGPLVCSLRHPTLALTPHTVSTYLAAHVHALGIDGSGHDLRHTMATFLLEDAGEAYLKTISQLLGHADTAVTERVYSLRYRGHHAEVLDQLRNPLQPPKVIR